MERRVEIVCCRTTLNMLRICCLIPSKGKELKPGKIFVLKWILLVMFSSITLVGSCLHFIMSMKDNVYVHLDIDVAIMLSMISTSMFGTYFFCNSKSASEMYIQLSDFETYDKPINFDENNELFDKLAFYHFIYLEGILSSLLIFSNIIKTGQCRRENIEYGIHEVCGLFSYTWMPFDIDYFPAKQIFLCLQLFGTHFIYLVAGTMAWAVVETVQHIIVRLRHATHLFLEAVKEKDAKKQREKFGNAVRYHAAVLSLEQLLNGTFGIFMFSHIAITAPILGTAMFAILHGGSGSSVFICLGWLVGVSMDCLSGQRLQNESVALASALYESEWYDCNEDIKRNILFVLMRCRNPMYLRASSFGAMDHVILLGVLKATYSYIALLTQTQ